MKYTCTWLLIAAILATGCSKNKTSDTPPPEEPAQKITVQVVEKETNKPIAGATVILEKCASYDIEFGCQSYSPIETLTTNDSGKATYTNSLKLERIEVRHPKYWTAINGNPVVLTPIATIKAVIKKVKSYPDTVSLSIAAHVADCYYNCIAIFQNIGLPSDTVVFLKGWGYANNQVSWYTTKYQQSDSILNTALFHINGFDTVQVAINY